MFRDSVVRIGLISPYYTTNNNRHLRKTLSSIRHFHIF